MRAISSNGGVGMEIPLVTWVLRGFAVLLVALMLVNIWGTWRRTETIESALDVVSPPARGENDLRIQAHLDRNRLGTGSPVGCWFILQNTGTVPMRNVSMSNWSAPGFKPAGFVSVVVPELPPHSSVRFRPRPGLVTIDLPIRFMVSAEFSWNDGIETKHKLVGPLGPVVVEGDAEPRLYTVTRAALGYLKDLALPLVLVLFGEFYRKRSQAEAERQHERELDRASWNLMLPKIHEYNEQYYLQFGLAAYRAAAALIAANPATPASFDEATRTLLVFRKHARVLYERISGFYFRTRLAEQLVTEAENVFVQEMRKYVPADVLSEAVGKVTRHVKIHVFKQTVATETSVQSVRQGLVNWKSTEPDGANAAFVALKILFAVLVYDINLIYRFWYDDPPPPLEPMTEETALLLGTASASMQALAGLYDRYRKMAQERQWG